MNVGVDVMVAGFVEEGQGRFSASPEACVPGRTSRLRHRSCALRAGLLAAVALVLVVGCGGDDDGEQAGADKPVIEDPGPIHVHGLGINPTDEALFIATHTGLFRVPAGEEKPTRVANRYQDTMGFTVIGANRFLGSGHPDQREDLPPFLGLIRSDDAGESWKPVSLLGKRDFHVLEAAGKRVYGFGTDYESREEGLLASYDGGRSWEERPTPEPLISVAVDPRDPDRLVASGGERLHLSEDGARSWRTLSAPTGLLGWTERGLIYAIDAGGTVRESRDGTRWERVASVDGDPSAFEAVGGELYVALHDGTIERSADGGRSWQVRSRP